MTGKHVLLKECDMFTLYTRIKSVHQLSKLAQIDKN